MRDLYGPAQPLPDDHEIRQHRKSLPMPDAAFLGDWLARTCELVDKYRPEIVWFDWWIQHIAFDPYLRKFAAYYYNRAAQWDQGVAINYKYDAFPEGAAVFDVERGQLKGIRSLFWQTDTAVSKNSWGYVENNDYKTATSLIHDLIDIVSKNGALLLNIGPRPDGTIPEPEQKLLGEIGDWMSSQWGGNLWNAAVEGFRRGADRDRRGRFQRREARRVHRPRHSLHAKSESPLCHCSRLALKREALDS